MFLPKQNNQTNKKDKFVMDVLIKEREEILSQSIHVSNHHDVCTL